MFGDRGAAAMCLHVRGVQHHDDLELLSRQIEIVLRIPQWMMIAASPALRMDSSSSPSPDD